MGLPLEVIRPCKCSIYIVLRAKGFFTAIEKFPVDKFCSEYLCEENLC